MNTAYKIIMIVVGCVVAYFLMSLATNSQKMVQGISSQGKELKVIADLNQKIQSLESQLSAVNDNIRENSSNLNTVRSGLQSVTADLKNSSSKIISLEAGVRESDTRIEENTDTLTTVKSAVATVDEVNAKISDIEVKIQGGAAQSSADNIPQQVKSDITELGESIETLQRENKQISDLLAAKSAAFAELQQQFHEIQVKNEKYTALVETLSSSGTDEVNKNIKILLTKTSAVEEDSYKQMQKDIYTLSARVDGIKEVLATALAAGENKPVEQNIDIRKRVDSLEQRINDSKGYTEKLFKNIEKNIAGNNAGIIKKLAEVKDRLDAQLVAQSKQIALVVKRKKHSTSVMNKELKQDIARVNTDIEMIKQGLAGLQQKVESLSSAGKVEKDEPVGIVINKSFEQSLVMINTRKGTFIFNPYADFTGVIRVRDAGGNEKMVLVPYTGEYLKIGENIIDTGPFARSCVEGINCNIDVRGSMNVPVEK